MIYKFNHNTQITAPPPTNPLHFPQKTTPTLKSPPWSNQHPIPPIQTTNNPDNNHKKTPHTTKSNPKPSKPMEKPITHIQAQPITCNKRFYH